MSKILALSSDVHCRSCDGTGISLPLEFLELEKKIYSVLNEFPLPDIMGKGQWFFKPSTITRLIAYMYQKQDIEGKSIGCLATPTLAIGLSIFKELTNINMQIKLLDIDSDILDLISNMTKNIELHIYDIENQCPQDLMGTCDNFIFDPLYSTDHYKIGLSRCVQLIGLNRPDKSGYIVIPPEEIAPLKNIRNGKKVPLQLDVFRYLNDMSFCISDFKENFIEYSTPPSEANILISNSRSLFDQYKLDDWRGSNLIRIISTSETIPLVSDDVILPTKINDNCRIGQNKTFVQLGELSGESECTICSRCFTTYHENQKLNNYTSYWIPEVAIRKMPSWRAPDDQPFEIAKSCVGFENIQNGDLIVLRGPAAKVIWETLRDLETQFNDTITIDAILERSLPDFYDLNTNQVKNEAMKFIEEIMKIGLIKNRHII